jgi:competence protein ComEC
MLLLARLIAVPRWLAELGVLAAIGAYVLAVGLQPSVVRAGVAGGLASLAWLGSRPRDRWYFLLVGAGVLLAWNPYSLLDPGFQLSFAAVASIFLLVPRIDRRLEGYPVPRSLATMLAVSAACGAVTAPILWLDFGRVPLFSAVANVLAEPAMPPLLGLGLVSALVYPVLPSVAASLAWVNGWLAAYLALCARLVGGLPHAQVSSVRAVLVMADAVLLAWAVTRIRTPRRRRAVELCSVGALLGAMWILVG